MNEAEQAIHGIASALLVVQASVLAVTGDDFRRRRAGREQLLGDLREGVAATAAGLATTKAHVTRILNAARGRDRAEQDISGVKRGLNFERAQRAMAPYLELVARGEAALDTVKALAGEELDR